MCCTTIQLEVTIEPTDFFLSNEKHRKCFQTFVDNFSLAINLRMIGNAEMHFGSVEPEQFLPKIVGESWISVRDNRMRHSMRFEDIIHENLSLLWIQ
jgi:hypothetical protein